MGFIQFSTFRSVYTIGSRRPDALGIRNPMKLAVPRSADLLGFVLGRNGEVQLESPSDRLVRFRS